MRTAKKEKAFYRLTNEKNCFRYLGLLLINQVMIIWERKLSRINEYIFEYKVIFHTKIGPNLTKLWTPFFTIGDFEALGKQDVINSEKPIKRSKILLVPLDVAFVVRTNWLVRFIGLVAQLNMKVGQFLFGIRFRKPTSMVVCIL